MKLYQALNGAFALGGTTLAEARGALTHCRQWMLVSILFAAGIQLPPAELPDRLDDEVSDQQARAVADSVHRLEADDPGRIWV